MDQLPNEILIKLCSYFSVVEMEVFAKLSRRLKALAEDAINHRVSALRKFISLEECEEVKRFFDPRLSSPLTLLKKYESTNCVAQFRLMNFFYDRTQKLGDLFQLISGDGDLGLHDNYPLPNELLNFIPAHNLVMVLAEGRIYFINEKYFFTVGDSLDPILWQMYDTPNDDGTGSTFAYRIETSDPFRGFTHNDSTSSRVALVDAYHENVVICSQTLRTPCFYTIGQVSHPSRTVTLHLLRQVFLPFTIFALRVYCQRLIMFFTTGFVGIWRICPTPQAELILSSRKVTGNVDSQMFRIHNLIIIKSGPSDYDILDGASDGVELHVVPLLDLLAAALPVSEYKEVDKIELTGNILIVKARGVLVSDDESEEDDEDSMEAASVSGVRILCVMKLKRPPTLTDFLSVDNFISLTSPGDSEYYFVDSDSFLLIPPSIVPGRCSKDIKFKASLLMTAGGVHDTKIYDLLESNPLADENIDPKHVPVDQGWRPSEGQLK